MGAFSVSSGAVTGVTTLVASGAITGGTITGGNFKFSTVQVVAAQQAAVADVTLANDPGDGTIAALSSSLQTSQSEFQALRDEVEKLRDWNAELRQQMNDLLSR